MQDGPHRDHALAINAVAVGFPVRYQVRRGGPRFALFPDTFEVQWA